MLLRIFIVLTGLTSYATISSAAVAIVPMLPFSTEPDSATVKAAIEELRNLPKKQKKQKIKEVRTVIREYKAVKKAGQETDTNTLLLAILAIFLPPLAVYLHQGEANTKFWITLLLFTLGIIGAFTIGWYLFLASVIYALIVILGDN